VLTRTSVAERLCLRFPDLDQQTVHRCVSDLWACCRHLGVELDGEMVERLAATRLTGIVKGARLSPHYQVSAVASGWMPTLRKHSEGD
jgi:hypothetical protein